MLATTVLSFKHSSLLRYSPNVMLRIEEYVRTMEVKMMTGATAVRNFRRLINGQDEALPLIPAIVVGEY